MGNHIVVSLLVIILLCELLGGQSNLFGKLLRFKHCFENYDTDGLRLDRMSQSISGDLQRTYSISLNYPDGQLQSPVLLMAFRDLLEKSCDE